MKCLWKYIIKIKAEILCWGLRSSKTTDEIYRIQHPSSHKRTGNAGIHIILNGEVVLNAIYGEKFCEKSPYNIEKIKNKFWLSKNNTPVCKISIIEAPRWYANHTTKGILMCDVLLQEGVDTLISGLWNNCCYFKNGTECKFCILGYEKGIEWKNINDVIDTVNAALKENPNYYIHLTGGNTFTPDNGIKYYEKYVRAIRKESNISISLEVSPPANMKYLDNIISAGADGFSINIEIWDETKRKEICPGKSQIKRELYFKAWERGVELLGKFRISSILIVGLDTPKNIEEAIKQMVRIGVKPVLIPFRPFGKSILGSLPSTNPVDLLKLSAVAGAELKKAGAKEKEFVGCEHCGACTIEKEFMNL